MAFMNRIEACWVMRAQDAARVVLAAGRGAARGDSAARRCRRSPTDSEVIGCWRRDPSGALAVVSRVAACGRSS